MAWLGLAWLGWIYLRTLLLLGHLAVLKSKKGEKARLLPSHHCQASLPLNSHSTLSLACAHPVLSSHLLFLLLLFLPIPHLHICLALYRYWQMGKQLLRPALLRLFTVQHTCLGGMTCSLICGDRLTAFHSCLHLA